MFKSRVKQILQRLTDTVSPVRFIQIGSNDGVTADPLRAFILKDGWRGVLVEPVAGVFGHLKENYSQVPRTTCIRAAITDFNGEVDFWRLGQLDKEEELPYWYDQIGSLVRKRVLRAGVAFTDLSLRVVKDRVPCMTFASLVRRGGLVTHKVDLVHIDAEGEDGKILQQALDYPWRYGPPTVIFYEHRCMLKEEEWMCQDLLRGHGYDLLRETGDTIAYKKEVLKL